MTSTDTLCFLRTMYTHNQTHQTMWELAIMIVMVLIVAWMIHSCECHKRAAKADIAPAVAPAPAPTPAPEVSTAATAAAEKKEGFCPKLAQRHGMCAGAESMNPRRGSFDNMAVKTTAASFVSSEAFEPFRSGRVGAGTMYERSQRATTLPLA